MMIQAYSTQRKKKKKIRNWSSYLIEFEIRKEKKNAIREGLLDAGIPQLNDKH